MVNIRTSANAFAAAPAIGLRPGNGSAPITQITPELHERDAQILPEVSIVMPCLNEADTVGTCIKKAMQAMHENGIHGEVVVADNGSTDGSQQIAMSLGARVVDVHDRGYGNALMGGIEAARARFIIMGDADDSYDFGEIPKFIVQLRAGYQLVQGCRLPSGGGTVKPGAMPILHRWWGNPTFSLLARWWFCTPVHDVYCGLRGFTRSLYDRLDLRSPGMEFATEMIIKASRHAETTAEVPITLHQDGRKSHPPHLKTFRDGWRTLRYYLMHCPRWLFLEPGRVLMVLGIIGYALALPGVHIGGVHLDLNALLVASLAILCGQQAVLFAIGTKVLAISSGQCPQDPRIERFFSIATLERGLILGGLSTVAGLTMIGAVLVAWRRVGFGNLDHESTMRWAIPGATLVAGGVQTILSSFFISIIGTLHQVRERSRPRTSERGSIEQIAARATIATPMLTPLTPTLRSEAFTPASPIVAAHGNSLGSYPAR